MLLPEVVGVKLVGKLNPVATSTDLVLTLTNALRKKGYNIFLFLFYQKK